MNSQQFGIIERPARSFESYVSAGYTVITTGLEDNNTRTDLYAALKNPKKYETVLPDILRIKFI